MTFLLIMTGLLLLGFIIFLLDQKNRGAPLRFKTMIFTVISASLSVFGYVNIGKPTNYISKDLKPHSNITFQVSSLRGDLYRLESALEHENRGRHGQS